MNILLNIPEAVIGKYQEKADNDKRSRKNLMEKVLIDFIEQPKTSIQSLNNATNELKPFEHPKTNYFVDTTPKPIKVRKSPEQWVAEKRQILDNEEYQVWFNELQSDPYLSDKQKSIIKQA